jgi:hypothetical protein
VVAAIDFGEEESLGALEMKISEKPTSRKLREKWGTRADFPM